jgi:hypothetical protein
LAQEKVLGWVLKNSPSLDWGGVVVPAIAGVAGWAIDVEGFAALPASASSGW